MPISLATSLRKNKEIFKIDAMGAGPSRVIEKPRRKSHDGARVILDKVAIDSRVFAEEGLVDLLKSGLGRFRLFFVERECVNKIKNYLTLMRKGRTNARAALQ